MQTTTAARVDSLYAGYGGSNAGGVTRLITPALRPTIYRGERGKWNVDLVITRPSRRGFSYRFGLGYVDATGKARREYQGEVLPGPYAYAFGLATAITADPRMSTRHESEQNRSAGTEVEVADGDLIRLGGEIFAVRYLRDQWIELDHVASAI